MKPNNLQKYREAAKLTQQGLADLLHKKAHSWKSEKQKISNYERISDPSILVANTIVLILNEYISVDFNEVFPFYLQKKWARSK